MLLSTSSFIKVFLYHLPSSPYNHEIPLFFISASSPVCVVQLILGLGPALVSGDITKELSFFQEKNKKI